MTFTIRVVKIGDKYVKDWQYSQGLFDYILTDDPLHAFNLLDTTLNVDCLFNLLKGVNYKICEFDVTLVNKSQLDVTEILP